MAGSSQVKPGHDELNCLCIEERDLSFVDTSACSSLLRDQHIVRAPRSRVFGGEAPADFRTMDDIEVQRGAFVLQLSKAR
jgi:hypothetical protein